MTRWRKKPIAVNAFQMTKERMNDDADWPGFICNAWLAEEDKPGALRVESMDGEGEVATLTIYTLEGPHIVQPDAWIVQGPLPPYEIWAVRDDIFRNTYERVED